MATGSGLKGVKGVMLRDEKLRTVDKQRQLETHYEQKLKELLEEAGEATKEGEEQISDTRNSQLARLQHLVNYKVSIEKELLKHSAGIFEAFQTMKLELETVLKAKIGDYNEAKVILEDASRKDDEEDAQDHTGHRNHHDDPDRTSRRSDQDKVAATMEKQQSKKKVRRVPTKAHD